MSPTLKLTAIVRPFDPSSELPTALAPRQFDAVDEFIAALGHEIGATVPVMEGTLGRAPEDGLIVVFDAGDLMEHPDLGPRVILVNADRSRVPDCLEQWNLCAAIEKNRYFMWKSQRASERGAGVFGRKDVAGVMGAVLSKPFQSEHYALLSAERYADLPALLARYLVSYLEMFPELAAIS